MPSKTQLAFMLQEIVEECKSGMDSVAQGVQKSLTFISKQVSKVPDDMTEKFGTQMDIWC